MDNRELAKLVGLRLLQRRDVKAVQQGDGSYRPAKEPFTLSDLVAHLDGDVTYGHYVVDQDNQCRVFAFDLDLKKVGEWREDADSPWVACEPRQQWANSNGQHPRLTIELRCLAEGLALCAARLWSIPVAVAYSGAKGLHVYGFLNEPMDAAGARGFALGVLKEFNCFEPVRGDNFWKHTSGYRCCEIELFPKQETIREGGYGNLLRLPLGINRKSMQPGFFLNLRTGYDQPFRPDDALAALTHGSLRPEAR